MSYTVNDPSRVGRQTYWMYYVAIMVATWAMYGWAIYEYIKFQVVPIVFGVVAPLILSVYFRVIASRRCRDIGWPAILPWVTWLLPVVCGVISGMNAASHSLSAVGAQQAAALSGLGGAMIFGMFLGLMDFVFQIVIGCIAGRDDGGDASLDNPYGMPTHRSNFDSSEPRRAARMPQAMGAAPISQGGVRQGSRGDVPARGAQGFGRRTV